MKELKDIKLNRITTEFNNYMDTLLCEYFKWVDVTLYLNDVDDTIIYINHKVNTIRVNVYLFPCNIINSEQQKLMEMIYDIIGFDDYEMFLYYDETSHDNDLG